MRAVYRRGAAHTAALALTAALGAASSACARVEPVRVTREVFAASVTIEAYGEDREAVRAAVDAAFEQMLGVDRALDPYDEGSATARFNRDPYRWHELPPEAVTILDAADRLDVSEEFSPALFGVTRLYDFGGKERVPSEAELLAAVERAGAFERRGDRARFQPPRKTDPPPPTPGLDFGGAAKGLGIARAATELRRDGHVEAALISAGSSTLTLGRKPDGEPWRVGIEDPRDTGRILAVVESGERTATVSTSGDYQQYFERDGIRYHHILDPETGRPVRGMRSLTVAGDIPALDSDILSTALFVMGPRRAIAYARERRIALYAVDADGNALLAPAPAEPGVRLRTRAGPRR